MNGPRLSRLALLLASALALLSGCGGGNSKSSTKASQTTPAQTSTTAVKPIANPFKRPTTPPHQGSLDQLVAKDVVRGHGAVLHAGDTAIADYVGADYRTGKVFDSSWQKGRTPLRIAIDNGGVIAGWWQGLPGMRVGGRRVLMIPPVLGYGKNGSPPAIKPNEPLFFVVDLLGVVPAQPAGTAAGGTPQQ